MPTVGLVIIAKNEAHVLPRAIASAPWVDCVTVVIDAENTDNTLEVLSLLISSLYVHILPFPGSVAGARNDAIKIAEERSDYLLMLDADDVFEGSLISERDKDSTAALDRCGDFDHYELTVIDGDWRYTRECLFRSKMGYRYEGIDHEVLVPPADAKGGKLEGLVYKVVGGGSQSANVKAKSLRRAKRLLAELEQRPADPRTMFYAAWSLKDGGELAEALRYYRMRAALLGWAEETFFAQYEVAKVLEMMGEDPLSDYLKAYDMRPSRAEPLWDAARWCREKGRFRTGLILAKKAASLKDPGTSFSLRRASTRTQRSRSTGWRSTIRVGKRRPGEVFAEVKRRAPLGKETGYALDV